MAAVLVGFALPVIVMAVFIALLSRNIIRVPPDEGVVLSGKRQQIIDPLTREDRFVGYRVITGGSAFRIPIVERVDCLPLAQMSIHSELSHLLDSRGRIALISALVNCRISSDGLAMERAITRFLTMDLSNIEQIARTTIESRIMDLFPTIDASDKPAWPEHALVLEVAVRSDLDVLGISVDNVIFRGPPEVHAVAASMNGQGVSRSG